MHYVILRSLKIVVSEEQQFFNFLDRHLQKKQALLIAPITLRRLQTFLLVPRHKAVAQHVSLFFTEDKPLVSALRKIPAADAENKSTVSNAKTERNNGVGKKIEQKSRGDLTSISGHRTYFEIIENAVLKGYSIAFLGFTTEIEGRLKYNLLMTHRTPDDGSSIETRLGKANVYFIHREALLKSDPKDIEKLLEKISPRLIVCENKGIITFHFKKIVARLGCVFFWLDDAILKRAIRQRQKIPVKRKAGKLLYVLRVLGKIVLGFLKLLLRMPKVFVLMAIWPFLAFHRQRLLFDVRRQKLQTFQ